MRDGNHVDVITPEDSVNKFTIPALNSNKLLES